MLKNSINAGKCRKIPLMQENAEKFQKCRKKPKIPKMRKNAEHFQKCRKVPLFQKNSEYFVIQTCSNPSLKTYREKWIWITQQDFNTSVFRIELLLWELIKIS
jgi:hypothetical protein